MNRSRLQYDYCDFKYQKDVHVSNTYKYKHNINNNIKGYYIYANYELFIELWGNNEDDSASIKHLWNVVVV